MRQLMTLALSLGVAVSAVAQTQGEIIIRRPGVPDRVIRLDSGAVKEQIAKVQQQLHEMTITSRLRTNTLALKEGERVAQTLMVPMLRNLESGMRRPIIGISIDVEPRETDKIGAYVQAVTPGSPAEKAGILSGDIIVRVAGKSVIEKTSKDETGPGMRLISILSTLAVGKPVDIELRRGTKTLNFKVAPVEDSTGGSIARMTAPSIALGSRIPAELFNGELSVRSMPATPQGLSLFSNTGGNFAYGFMNNGLFSNIELAALNEKLGSYFAATEGVLVVNVGAPREMWLTAPVATDRAAAGRRGGAGRIMTDTVTVRARGNSTTGRMIDTTFTLPRGGTGAVVRRHIDTAAVYIDGVPMAGDVVRRKAPNIPVEPGDVIVSVDGRKVTSPSQLMRIVASYERNDEFKLQIIRQKRSETLTIKVP